MAQTIRAFRSAVALAKRKGLLQRTIDARSVVPTPALERSLRKISRVLTGDAAAVKLSPSEIKKKRDQGYKIVKPKGSPARAIIPISPGDKITVSHGKAKIKYKSGVTALDIEPDVSNAKQIEKWIAANKSRINGMKKRGEFFAFKLKGYNSSKIYTNIQLLFDDIFKYDIFQGSSSIDFHDAVESIQIVTTLQRAWDFGGKRRRTQASFTSARKRKQKFDRSPEWKKEQIREQRAAQARAYRAKLKARGGTAYEQYKTDAKKRNKKSRKKR